MFLNPRGLGQRLFGPAEREAPLSSVKSTTAVPPVPEVPDKVSSDERTIVIEPSLSSRNTKQSPGVIVKTGSSQYILMANEINDPFRENMALAISSIFFCCFLGMAATIKASDAQDCLRRADYVGAQKASHMARRLGLMAIGLGMAIWFFVLIINAFFVVKGDYTIARYGHVHNH